MLSNVDSLNRRIGLLFSRDDIINPQIKDLHLAMHLQLLEANIMLQAIDFFLNRKLHFFDSLVGDNKCQTRVSMLLDVSFNISLIDKDLLLEKEYLEQLIIRITKLLQDRVNFNKFLEVKSVIQELEKLTLADFFEKHSIHIESSSILELISLCFITGLDQEKLRQLSTETVSLRKIINLMSRFSKTKLNKLSIDFERITALNYGSCDEQIVLKQVEIKGFYNTVAFFPSFKPMLEKMKQRGQAFIQKTTHFCLCGGIKNFQFSLFRPYNGKFQSDVLLSSLEAVMVIEGYHFEGSLHDLKQRLGIPAHETFVKDIYLRPCDCPYSSFSLKINNIEEAILANFVQHRQFTNDAQIDWEGLGLLDSDLKKEFDYLNTLSGYSIDDMSKFCINHIYASTIEQVIQEQKAFAANHKFSHSKSRNVSKSDVALI